MKKTRQSNNSSFIRKMINDERNQKYNFNNQRQNKKYNYNTYVQLQYEINDDDDETNRVNMRVY